MMLLIKNYLSNILPEYMIPSYFVFIDAFPLNSNGKVNVIGLPEPVVSLELSFEDYNTDDETTIYLLNACKEILNKEKIF